MANIDDGGSISPQWAYDENGIPVQTTGGVSVRDHFASAALMSMGTWIPEYDQKGNRLFGSHGSGILNLFDPQIMRARAEWAYAQADAMIAARKTDNG